MNRLFRTEGIVLKSIKLNEADKIITIFSNDYGKIRGIAKGVRKTKSKFGSSLENLSIVKLLIYKGKNLNIISQTDIVNSFFSKCKNLFKYGLAINCAEIIDKLIAEEDPNQKIYFLFKNLIFLLKDERNPTLLVESFKWKLFALLGYQPEINNCLICTQSIKRTGEYIFDIPEGRIFCRDCYEKTGSFQMRITSYQIKLLQRILVVDLEKIHNKTIDECNLSELKMITDTYMSYHFGIENKSKHFLNKLEILH